MKRKQPYMASIQGKSKRLSCLLIAGLLAPAYPLSALAAGIAAVSGSGTGVTTQNGVSVVTIIAPSASGLSHNRYTDFNVGTPGAVFNNSAVAGTSQLAGQLAANAALQGRQARVILNEVVTANPSQLLGKQEVFGQRADLVLANPNGITCNGCGFINVSQATLAVAAPTVEGGVLSALRVTNPNALLQVDGTVRAEGTDVLRLIAPKATIGGSVNGGQQISLILGHNAVDEASGQVSASTAMVNTDRRYDSTLFGAMQAGRIQILSTPAGVGVNLNAATLQAADIEVDADQIAIRGKVTQSTTTDYHYHGWWWNWWKWGWEYLDQDAVGTSQAMTRSQLNATGNLTLKANDTLTVSAADLSGRDVTLTGNTVTLGTESTTDTFRDYFRNAINWWYYEKNESRDTTTQHGSRLNAGNLLSIDAGQSASLTGAQLTSLGDARLTAGSDLRLAAAVNTDARSFKEYEANRTFINNSSSSSNFNNQSLVVSSINASGDLALDAGRDLNLNAAKLTSGGDSLLSASGALAVDAQSFKTSQSASSAFSNTGGFFGGYDSSSDSANTLTQGSDLQAGGTTYLVADGDVRVRGSRVKAVDGVYAVSRNGGIGIDVAKGTSLTSSSDSSQTVFGITTDASSTQTTQQVIKGSDLLSDANLTLISADDTEIIGSLLQAAGDIGISAAGGLIIKVATADTTTSNSGSTTQGYAEGGITDGQVFGSVGIETVTTSSTTQSTDVAGSTLQAGDDIDLSAGNVLTINGSQVQSGDDISLSGTDIDISAAQSTQSTQTTTDTVSGGLFGSAEIAQIGVGVEVNVVTTTATSESSTAQVSSLTAGGDITMVATDTLTLQGAQLSADGAVDLSADTLTASVAENQQQTQIDSTEGSGSIGVTLDLSGALSLTATMTPSVEVAVTESQSSSAESTQQGASISGGTVNVTVAGDASLTGAQLESEGDLTLSSGGDLLIAAATDSQSTSSSTQSGSVEVSVDIAVTPELALSGASLVVVPEFTVTGVSVSGDYEQSESTSSETQAVAGSISSGGDLQISSGGDLVATGDLSAAGDASLSAEGDLVLAATRDTNISRSESEAVAADIDVSLDGSDVQGGSISASVEAVAVDERTDSPQGGTVTVGGELSLSSGGDTILTATEVQAGTVIIDVGGELTLQSVQSTQQESGSSVEVDLFLQSDLGSTVSSMLDGQMPLEVNSTQSATLVEGDVITVSGV